MKILILNGPNLSLVGEREPLIYGGVGLKAACHAWAEEFSPAIIQSIFSNHEGELIDALHKCGFDHDGIILNPGGYTHTSVALRDAVAAIRTPVIEVHISNPSSRESFRHISLISPVARGTISGLGLMGYRLAIQWLLAQEQG